MSLRLVHRFAAVPVLLGGLLLPALTPPAATAGTATAGTDRLREPQHFTFVRDAGMPTTDVPSRTLGSADAWARPTADGGAEVSVSVTLDAAPTPDTAADLRIGLGSPGEDGCVVTTEWVVRTDAPGAADPAAPDGVAALTVAGQVPAGEVSAASCLVVTLTDPDAVPGAALDRWTAAADRVVRLRAEPGQARVVDVAHTRLPVRTWSYVEVRVRVRFHRVTSIRVDGRGADLRVVPVTVTGDFERKEQVVVNLPVRLRVARARTLRLDTAVAGVALPMVDRERVRIRPR